MVRLFAAFKTEAARAARAYLEYCIIFVLPSPHSTENVYRNDESSW